MQRRLFLAHCLWLAGCTSIPRRLPTSALPTQHSLVRGQLVLHSDFPLPRQHRLLDELAQQRNVQAETLLLAASDEPIHVYLFQTPESFATYIAEKFPTFPARRAFFVETDTQLAVYAHWGDRVAEDLRHEVAHGYLHASVRQLPLWLDEGLAEYFEVPRAQRGLNAPHVSLLASEIGNRGWQPSLQRLEALDAVAEMNQLDYAESWAWVHSLLETTPERRAALQEYLQLVRNNPQSTPPLSVVLRKIDPQPDQTLLAHLGALQSQLAAGTPPKVASAG